MAEISGIEKYRDLLKVWDGLLENFKTLGAEFGR